MDRYIHKNIYRDANQYLKRISKKKLDDLTFADVDDEELLLRIFIDAGYVYGKSTHTEEVVNWDENGLLEARKDDLQTIKTTLEEIKEYQTQLSWH